MTKAHYQAGWRGRIEGVEFVTIHAAEAPEAFWRDNNQCALIVGLSRGKEEYRSLPTLLSSIARHANNRDHCGECTVLIPAHYIEPTHNKLGEVCP